MAKKNLASALAGQKARAAARAKQAVIDEALSRKAASIGAAARKQGAAKRAPTGEAAPLEGAGDGDDESAAAAPAALDKGKRRQPRAFERDDAVLLVGEGNFSFTLALLSPPHAHPPHLVTATALDSEAECCAKYPDAAAHVARIREIAGRDDVVVFGVDAGNLQASKAVCGTPAAERRYSKVWWGFPHCGAGHKDESRNVLANQLQILRFLVSVAPLLSRGPKPAYASTATAKDRRRKRDAEEADLDFEAPSADEDEAGVSDLSEAEDEAEQALAGSSSSSAIKRPFVAPPRAGSVLITLRNTTPYTLWDVPLLAKRLPLVLPAIAKSAPALPRGQKAPTIADVTATFCARRYALWRSFEFEPDEWPGYEHRRTVGWIDGVSKGANEDLRRRPAPAAPTPPTPGVPGRGKGWKEGKAGGGAAQKERASKAAGGECRTWEFGTESGVHDSASGGGMGGKGVKRRK